MRSRSRRTRRRYSKKPFIGSKKIKQAEFLFINAAALVILIVLIVLIRDNLFIKKRHVSISSKDVSAFQVPNMAMTDIKLISDKYSVDFTETLTLYCMYNNFFPTKAVSPTAAEIEQILIKNYDTLKKEFNKNEFNGYNKMLNDILTDFVYFPIPRGYDLDASPSFMFGDTWGKTTRNDKAKVSEGTDIVDRENIPGRIPITSISSGIVKDAYFDDLIGYTVRISTEKGITFTYSRLDKFAENIVKGAHVNAGQIIGQMGCSGNDRESKNFVFLHIRMTVDSSKHGKNFPINPYPFLRFKEAVRVDLTPQI